MEKFSVVTKVKRVLLSLMNVAEKSQSDRAILRPGTVHYKVPLLKQGCAILLD